MQAIKGGWSGQVFAFAASNDSGGRKSRIRRSKEERKMMVESFIKKYQKSNDGIFPTLNLTHKEVGGSFYTVREIVREIIQENRVLAPPKVLLQDHGHSEILEHHPLGSIYMEPQTDLSVSGTHNIITNDVHIHHQEQNMNNNEIINKNKEFGKRIHTESVVMEIRDRAKSGAKDVEVSEAVISHVESDVMVETFPLSSVSRTTQNMNVEFSKLQDADGAVEDKAIQHDEMSFVQSYSDFVHEKDEKWLRDLTVELDSENRDDIILFESKDYLQDGTKASNSTEIFIPEDSTADRIKSCDQDNNSLQKRSNPELDTINLETWEGASKKSTGHGSNTLLALVKAFITSFVKFWTE